MLFRKVLAIKRNRRKNYERETEMKGGLFKRRERTFRCHGTRLYVMCEIISAVS